MLDFRFFLRRTPSRPRLREQPCPFPSLRTDLKTNGSLPCYSVGLPSAFHPRSSPLCPIFCSNEVLVPLRPERSPTLPPLDLLLRFGSTYPHPPPPPGRERQSLFGELGRGCSARETFFTFFFYPLFIFGRDPPMFSPSHVVRPFHFRALRGFVASPCRGDLPFFLVILRACRSHTSCSGEW